MPDAPEVSEIRIPQAFLRLLSDFHKAFFEHMLQQVANWRTFEGQREEVVTSCGWSSW